MYSVHELGADWIGYTVPYSIPDQLGNYWIQRGLHWVRVQETSWTVS